MDSLEEKVRGYTKEQRHNREIEIKVAYSFHQAGRVCLSELFIIERLNKEEKHGVIITEKTNYEPFEDESAPEDDEINEEKIFKTLWQTKK